MNLFLTFFLLTGSIVFSPTIFQDEENDDLPVIEETEEMIEANIKKLLDQKVKSGYKAVTVEELKALPETFKNKKIVLSSTYYKFQTAFLNYMKESGFESEKYFWVRATPYSIPFLAKKNSTFNPIIPNLAKLTRVIIAGKIKPFKEESKNSKNSSFYFEVESITIAKSAKGQPILSENEEDENIEEPQDEKWPSVNRPPRRGRR